MFKITPNIVHFVVQVTSPIPGVDWRDHDDLDELTAAQICADILRRDLAEAGYDNKVRIVRRELVETEV